MDTPATRVEPAPGSLAVEIRHSAMLLGGALGLMGLRAAAPPAHDPAGQLTPVSSAMGSGGTCRSCGTHPGAAGPGREAPGAVVVDATLGLGGHSAALLERFGALRLVGVDRDPEALGSPATGSRRTRDRATLVHAVYDEIPTVLAAARLRAGAGRAVRPRGLVAAARRGRPRLRLRAGRAAGHADGPEPGRHRSRGPQHLPGGRAGAGAPGVRRGAVRPPDRRRGRPRAGRGAVHRHCPAGRAGARRRSRRPPGVPAGTRPSAPSRRCASRSTASWTR